MYNETTGDTIRNAGDGVTAMAAKAIALGYTIQDYSGTCIACDASKVTVTSCGRCIPCALGRTRPTLKHEAGERLSFAFAKRELDAVGMSIVKTDGEYRVYQKGGSALGYFTTSLADALTTGRINAASLHMVHVTMTLALADPFQPMAHEAEAYGGRLSALQARQWAADGLAQLSAFDANVIAKLLEDRAAMCARNGLQCDDLDAGMTASYWRDQQAHASNLAAQFRKAGK